MLNTLRTIVVGLTSMAWHASLIILASLRGAPDLKEIASRRPRQWAHDVLDSARVEVEVVGLENIPEGASVLVANHESWFDVFALVAHLPVDYRFVGKVELTRIPLFGRAWQAAGHIPIDRRDRQKAMESLERAGELIRRDGAVVVMFPEGTRSPDGRLLPFKKGAFVLAAQTEVPIIPVAITGSRAVMAKGSFWIRPGKVQVRIGPPIPTEGRGAEDRDALLGEARAEIERLRGALPRATTSD